MIYLAIESTGWLRLTLKSRNPKAPRDLWHRSRQLQARFNDMNDIAADELEKCLSLGTGSSD